MIFLERDDKSVHSLIAICQRSMPNSRQQKMKPPWWLLTYFSFIQYLIHEPEYLW